MSQGADEWACEESNPLVAWTPGLRPGADPTLQHARRRSIKRWLSEDPFDSPRAYRIEVPALGEADQRSAESKWSRRELHPHSRYATPVSSCWTTAPGERPGSRTPTFSSSGRRADCLRQTFEIQSCLGRTRTSVSTFRASRPTARRQGKSGANGCRPRTSCSTGRRADLLHHGTEQAGQELHPRLRTWKPA